jgi:hypothetical protein
MAGWENAAPQRRETGTQPAPGSLSPEKQALLEGPSGKADHNQDGKKGIVSWGGGPG